MSQRSLPTGETKQATEPVAIAVLVPNFLLCPMTKVIMKDPVSLIDGSTFEHQAIKKWLQTNNTNPLTGLRLSNTSLRPNDWCLNQLRIWRDSNSSMTGESLSSSEPSAPPSDEAVDDINISNPSCHPDDDQLGCGPSKGPRCSPSSLLKLSQHFCHLDPIRADLGSKLSGWKPPVVVVFGEESCSKSTILERIAMVPLFPKGEELCTRLPILIQLRNNRTLQKPSLFVMKRVQGGQDEVMHGPGEFPSSEEPAEVVRRTMLDLIKQENEKVSGISAQSYLKMSLFGPNLPDVDLLDLPGIVVNSQGKGKYFNIEYLQLITYN